MARATRPLRRVRGAERDRLRAVVATLTGGPLRFVPVCWRGLALRYAADKLACRPAQLRRCLLGRPVSAHAAARILARAA
jgi:hypothetical protein